jgi:adenine phosphoribosyltransferase
LSNATLQQLSDAIRNVPDYPKPGILFKDITPLLKDPLLFSQVLDALVERLAPYKADYILGVEARGFIFGAALADRLKVGFIPARKKGKLPSSTLSYSYALEYGIDTIEIHDDAMAPHSRVIVLDDLLGTGGTAAAVSELVKQLEGDLVAYGFVIELDFLNGRQALGDVPVESLLHY